MKDTGWREELSRRKKAERAKRISALPSRISALPCLNPEEEKTATFLGLLSFVSGITEREELFVAAERCRRRGGDFLFNPAPEKTAEFSSRPLEGGINCSSRPLRL